ncbi:MAG: relaxase/mobilization nuclease domain-containing protein, partial [Tannerella sp.]|nr:relaxase/mobilization nuclease domain-containing protein [Tannerella sp.]
MLAKISSGKSVFGVLAYNKIKVDDNHASVLYSQKMFDSPDGTFSIRDCMDSFTPYLSNNERTEKVVFHASLNPDPKDNLSDERLSDIAQAYMEKLGYGNQPYIVLKHSDIKREHLHIISLRIDEAGKKINDSYEVARSMKICKELEQEFNLIPLKKGEREFEYPNRIDYREGDLKHKAGNTIKAITANFHFQSFGEYRTMLELFNLTAEEVKGMHNGILYSVTDGKGNKMGRPFKSSLFGKEAGCEALQKHYENSKLAVEKKKIRENLCPVITQAMREAKGKDSFRSLLKQKHIGVVFRENEQGRIYGVTFIDYQNRTVLNGSRLGKEFSANMFQDLFSQECNLFEYKDDVKSTTELSNQENHKNQGSDGGSLFGLLDVNLSGSNDHEEENFVR